MYKQTIEDLEQYQKFLEDAIKTAEEYYKLDRLNPETKGIIVGLKIALNKFNEKTLDNKDL